MRCSFDERSNTLADVISLCCEMITFLSLSHISTDNSTVGKSEV